jgi:hypothetical protein
MQVVDQMAGLHRKSLPPFPRLHYVGQEGSDFAANDFEMIGEIPEPVITTKPKLL